MASGSTPPAVPSLSVGAEGMSRMRPARSEWYITAEAAGEHPVETWLRIMLASDGKALFHMRSFNVNLEHLEKMITTDWALPGLGDAGAHVSQMIDSGWSTFVLSHWHRDAGVYSIAEAVRRIAAEPARVLGLGDRGVLAAGKRADVNVIDAGRTVGEVEGDALDRDVGAAGRKGIAVKADIRHAADSPLVTDVLAGNRLVASGRVRDGADSQSRDPDARPYDEHDVSGDQPAGTVLADAETVLEQLDGPGTDHHPHSEPAPVKARE